MLDGVGRSMNELFTILIMGCDFRVIVINVFIVELQRRFFRS